MRTSKQGVAFIAAHEGIVTRAYRDAAGVWTIGVGHTAAAGPPAPARGMTVSRDEALAIFAGDLPRYERRVDATLGGRAQTVFDGAVSFDFNTGAVDRAAWVRYFRAGEMTSARAALLQWTKAGGRRLAGLVRRREDEARLIFDGDYGTAPAEGADEIRAWQADLAALGFYGGEIDGLAGPVSHAAVIAYQRSHPDLVVDGIVGPATRASIARDLAARRAASAAGAAAAAAGAATAAATEASGLAHPLLLAGLAALLVLAAAGAFLAWRYGSELRRLITRRKGT
jgi:lysozyme